MDIGKKIYKVSELAEMFSVSSRTVYNWIREKRIRVIRCGPKSTRVERAELPRLLGQGDITDE